MVCCERGTNRVAMTINNPEKYIGRVGDRTSDHLLQRPARYRLSYTGSTIRPRILFNLSPDMPVLDSFSLAANKDMMEKIWTNGDTVICLSRKHCGKRRNCSLRAISPFPTKFSKATCC